MGLYDRTAVAYDIIERSLGKDYESEAAELIDLVRLHRPEVASLLDVGCGVGEHLMHFAAALPEAEGVELSDGMVAEARHRHPGLTVHQGDMRSFQLERTFDAVTCLWGSIGYMTTTEDLARAVANMADHLRPGGVLLIEGWYSPEQWPAGRMATHITSEDGIGVGRMVASTSSEGHSLSQMHMAYMVLERGEVSQFTEVHTQGLFADEEYAGAMRAAGLEPRPPEGWSHRKMPMRVAVKPVQAGR